MKVVINANCTHPPEGYTFEETASIALINYLCALGYDYQFPPLAALLQSYHRLPGAWAIVSPIYWQASHNDAQIIAAGSDLELSAEQDRACFELFKQHVALDGMDLFYHDVGLWLLRIDGKPRLNARSVYAILHHSLMPQLQDLDVSLYWQKCFTECQMLFASAQITQVNGVWIWGNSGSLQPKRLKVGATAPFDVTAKMAQVDVTTINKESELKNYQLLLLESLDYLSTAQQQQLQHKTHTWYWNNGICHKTEAKWYQRIWRFITHAH